MKTRYLLIYVAFMRTVVATAIALGSILCEPAGKAAATIKDIATDTSDPSNLSDTEPSIAVNPINPLEIAVVSFSEGWGPGSMGPVWRSGDGGATWTKVSQLPQPNAASAAPGDQKLAFDASGNLYVAELAYGLTPPRLFVYRQTGTASAPLTVGSVYGSTNDDQPHLDVDRSNSSAFLGRLYSPWLDFSQAPERSTVANSTDSGATLTSVGAGNNTTFPNRTTRIAIAPDGKAYIIYKTREGTTGAASGFENAHFTVNRSDDAGVTWDALGANGVSVHGVATVQTFFTTSFGNPAKGKVARARSSDAWIAADPGDGDVYAAYVSRDGTTGFGQILVARSTDGGSNWNSTRVTDNTHNCAYPEIAAAANGAVGVLYIDYDDSGASTVFRHHLARSFDDGANWTDEILQSMDPGPIANASSGFLWGDYEGLTAVGHTFYGVFTGASIGRTTSQLDPIFFKESAVAADADFYVRDWTDTAASGDDGAEPSTHPVFYTTSDVWNRRSDAAGGFNANNQPQNEDPQNGSGTAGDNFAFTRVFRNSAGSAATVTAHFLYSEFGTGSNYVDAGSAAGATLSFGVASTSETLANGHPWHLDPTSSSHLCLAVEISTPADPFMPPTLLGRAPGWPTTDLLVINDNNKAQRNMGVYTAEVGETCGVSYYAIVHNAATSPRSIKLRFGASREALKNLRKPRIQLIGGRPQALADGTTITVPNVQPGENRWIGFHFDSLAATEGPPLLMTCNELVGDRVVNGFAVAVQAAPIKTVIRDMLEFDRHVFVRLAASFELGRAKEESSALEKMDVAQTANEKQYPEFMRVHAKALSESARQLLESQKSRDPFGLRESIKLFEATINTGRLSCLVAEHSKLLHRLDAFLTMLQKEKGDPADILQNVRWQTELYSKLPSLKRLECSRSLLERSQKFIRAYQARQAGSKDYPALIRDSLECFRQTAKGLERTKVQLQRGIADMERALNSPTLLQKAHRGYLLKLQAFTK